MLEECDYYFVGAVWFTLFCVCVSFYFWFIYMKFHFFLFLYVLSLFSLQCALITVLNRFRWNSRFSFSVHTLWHFISLAVMFFFRFKHFFFRFLFRFSNIENSMRVLPTALLELHNIYYAYNFPFDTQWQCWKKTIWIKSEGESKKPGKTFKVVNDDNTLNSEHIRAHRQQKTM